MSDRGCDKPIFDPFSLGILRLIWFIGRLLDGLVRFAWILNRSKNEYKTQTRSD